MILIKKALDRECSSDNTFLTNMTIFMNNKFDKYWNDCSILFSIACIIDPRMKMFEINYYYPQIYCSDVGHQKIESVHKNLFEIYSYYAIYKHVVANDITKILSSQMVETSSIS